MNIGELATVIGTTVEGVFIYIKTAIAGSSTSENQAEKSVSITPFGFISKPIKNLYAVRSETMNYSILLGYAQKAIEGIEEGEVCIFAKDDTGVVKSTIILKNDGAINVTSDSTIDFNNGNLTIEP